MDLRSNEVKYKDAIRSLEAIIEQQKSTIQALESEKPPKLTLEDITSSSSKSTAILTDKSLNKSSFND